jgi:hypothetical protein
VHGRARSMAQQAHGLLTALRSLPACAYSAILQLPNPEYCRPAHLATTEASETPLRHSHPRSQPWRQHAPHWQQMWRAELCSQDGGFVSRALAPAPATATCRSGRLAKYVWGHKNDNAGPAQPHGGPHRPMSGSFLMSTNPLLRSLQASQRAPLP